MKSTQVTHNHILAVGLRKRRIRGKEDEHLGKQQVHGKQKRVSRTLRKGLKPSVSEEIVPKKLTPPRDPMSDQKSSDG